MQTENILKELNPNLDQINFKILAERAAIFDQEPGPRVGDYLRTPDGLTRFTHNWGPEIDQIQTGGGGYSFYLGAGYISYSGSLDPGFKLSQIIDTGEIEPGKIWFFDCDQWQAYNGINAVMNFRIYKLKNI